LIASTPVEREKMDEEGSKRLSDSEK